ncbi:MAG: lysophospholipid acyltransferase family protein [Candidatus Eisenbacteria bacterium]
MSAGHAFEYALVRGIETSVRALPEGAALVLGAGLGDAARRLGLRRRVAADNLALAFPEWDEAMRERVLGDCYRELGRVSVEYPRLPELARRRDAFRVSGEEHLHEAAGLGRGVVMLTGHYGNFELGGAWLSGVRPVDFVVKPMSNPRVDAWITGLRERAGVGRIPLGAGIRAVYAALDAGRWIAILADQDAHGSGVFVPFFGRPASTPRGPAEIAVRRGVPILMGFCERLADGTRQLSVQPLLWPRADVEDPVAELTARHVAALEARIRVHPDHWFWLHRRWKTPPPGGTGRT